MKYVKSILFILFFTLVFILRAKATLLELPEHFKITNNAFLDKIMSLPGLETKIFLSKQNEIIPMDGTIFKMNGQELIKTNENLYI